MEKQQYVKAKQFHQLHEASDTFVLPNAWDVITAKVFAQSGFKAIGTTSAGIASSQGFQDGQHIPLNKMIETIGNIAGSVDIPVTADIEAGFGWTVDEVLETVKKVIQAGAIGINLEDGTGNPDEPIFDLPTQKEKIAAIKEHTVSTDSPLFINARTDMYWLSIGDETQRYEETMKRAEAYQKAGADCIFVPGLHDTEVIRKLREKISCPINLLLSSKLPAIQDLSTIGIERISCGSSPFRSTVTLLQNMSEEILDQGTFHQATDDVLSYGEVTQLL